MGFRIPGGVVGIPPGATGAMLVSNGASWTPTAAPGTTGCVLVSTASGAQWVKPAYGRAVGTTNNPTPKTGTTFETIPEMSFSVTPTGGRLHVVLKVNFTLQDDDSGYMRIQVGGVTVDQTYINYTASSVLALVPGHLDGADFVCTAVVTGLTPGVPVTVVGEYSETGSGGSALRPRETFRSITAWEMY